MRLIDADALSEKLCKTTVFIKDGEVFQRMINDAPTVSAEAVDGECGMIPIELKKRYPYSRDEDITDAFMRGYQAHAEAVQGWIPLSHDGLVTDFPHERDGEWVIVTDGKTISVERIKKDAYDHFFPNGRWFQLEDVVAWIPLPEPYKGGEDE